MTASHVASDGTYNNYVRLAWNYPYDNIDGFNIYKDGNWVTTLGKGIRNYKHVSNLAGTQSYQITAYKSVMVNGISTIIESDSLKDNGSIGQLIAGTLASSLTATKGQLTHQVELDWAGLAGTYLIYRDGLQIASVNGLNYIDNAAEPGIPYLYEVAPSINPNDLTAAQGWAKYEGYIEGSVYTLLTNLGLGGAVVEAKATIDGNTYYYTDSTDNDGSFAIPNIYYGSTTTQFTVTADLAKCGVEHSFQTNPRSLMLSPAIKQVSQVNFYDKTQYKLKGFITRAYSNCSIDSIRVFARYTFADGSTQTTTDAYTDKKGMYSIDINPIQLGLQSIRIEVDSTRVLTDSTVLHYRFQALGTSEWTGNALTCLDLITYTNYEDVLTYPVRISVVNGCGTPLTGGKYKIQVQSTDVCYDRTFTVNANTGELIADLPAMPLNIHVSGVENLTTQTLLVTEYLKYRPIVLKLDSLSALVNGNSNSPAWDSLTHCLLAYHLPPRIELTQGFTRHLCDDLQKPAIIEQGETYALNFQVIENFGSDCPVKNGYVKIRNAAAEEPNTLLNFDAQGNLATYTFTASSPNLVKPYLYNCYIAFYNLSNELLAEKNILIVVEGNSMLPGSDVIVDVGNSAGEILLPLYILRDPNGDASYSKIEKGAKLTKNITFSKSKKNGGGFFSAGKIIYKTAGGLAWEIDLKSGKEKSTEYTWEVTTTTTQDITTSADALSVGKDADVIVGAGLALQYGLAKKIAINGCEIMDSTVLALGASGINTTWIYTVEHINGLIYEYQTRIDKGERIQEGGQLQSVAYSRAFFQNKIDNWNRVLQYHEKETLPFYNLCVSPAPRGISQAQKDIYNQWQNGFCKLIRKNETGAFEPKEDIVWNQTLVDAYNVAETVLKNVVREDWTTKPYVWEFTDANLQKRENYIDAQYEAMHGIAAENITFSAGTSFSKTIESAKSSASKYDASTFVSLYGKIGVNALIKEEKVDLEQAPMGVGTSTNLLNFDAFLLPQFFVETTISESYQSAVENTNNIFYTLADDDAYDQFSVTVIQGIEPNQTPYFSLLGGRSSCPDEPGSMYNDDPHISILKNGGAVKYDEAIVVEPDGHATFKIQVSNDNPFYSTRDVAIRQIVESNPSGARLKIFGQSFVQNVFTNVSPTEPLTFDLTVERGLDEYAYENIQVVVMPTCYLDPNLTYTLTNGDTITFSVYFNNPCSNIALTSPEDDWVIQRRNLSAANNQEALPLKVAGFDVEDNNFQYLYFEYRRIGVNNDWIRVPNSIITKDALRNFLNINLFPNEIPYYWYIWDITDDFERYPNGEYQIRSVAQCLINGKTVLSYTNPTKGTIDRNQQLLGLPEPADKIWTYGDQISIGFNKDIQCYLIDSTNFVVRNMNQLVNGVYAIAPGKIYCHNNRLSFIPNNPMSVYDGDTLQFTVSGVYTVTGELLNDETWSFAVYARDLYIDRTNFDIEVYQGESVTLQSTFFNNKATGNLTYTILGLTPSPIIGSHDGTYSNWLTARNARLMQLQAGKNETVYFDINAQNLASGYYNVNFDVQDDFPNASLYPNALQFRIHVLPKPANWTVNPANYENSMNVMANYQFSNPTLPINTDTTDLISVWIGNEIRGVGKISKIGTNYMAAMNVYGNSSDNGKPLSFRVWDTETGNEYDAYPSTAKNYLQNGVVGTITSPIVLTVNQISDKARYISLGEGWNLFSLNSTKANDSLNKVLSSLKYLSNGDVIKTANQSAIFDSNLKQWISANGLHTMDIYHGYQIKLSHADTLRITGTLPNVLNKDSLLNGWNLIAAPLSVPMNIQSVLANTQFSSINQPDSMTLKTTALPGYDFQNMVAFYKSSQNPKWLYASQSGMNAIRPNFAYWLKVNKNTSLCMSSSACSNTTVLRMGANSVPAFDPFDTQTWAVNPADYEFNMLITAYIEIDNELMTQAGTKVAAYIGETCRGVGEIVYVPELQRYLLSMFVYANKDGETLHFRIYSPEKGKFYAHHTNIDFQNDNIMGSLDEPYRFSNLAPDNTFSTEVYPNPFQFKLVVNIASDIAQDYHIHLCDMMGKVIAVYELSGTGNQQSIEIKTSDLKLSEGVYLLHIKGSLGEQQAIKVIYNP